WNEAELNCQSSASQVIGFPFPSWLSTSPNATSAADEFISCTLDNLQPATTYSAYITIATLVKHEGAQSGRFNFTTKPAIYPCFYLQIKRCDQCMHVCKVRGYGFSSCYHALFTFPEPLRLNLSSFLHDYPTPSVPTYLHAVSVDPTSIQLLWSPPARPNGKIVFYKIRYMPMPLERNDFLSSDACYS
ncbi:hypothetical protein ACTXT7_017236, partial [Hymenolepis weldensis]